MIQFTCCTCFGPETCVPL